MPFLQRPDGCQINYEVRGTGIPVLFIAPGGMDSSLPMWAAGAKNPNSMKFFNPVNPEQVPEDKFQKIIMDQRCAGKSTGPLAQNGWNTYTQDQLALLDHLGIHKCLTIGSCIGPSYQFALMEAAPERFPASVLIQPVGLSKHMPHNTPVTPQSPEPKPWEGLNRAGTSHWFNGWANNHAKKGTYQEADLKRLQDQMFNYNDFVFSVGRDFVQRNPAPLLVLMGMDEFHPTGTSKEIALIAPNCELVEDWKRPDVVVQTAKKVTEFMLKHGANCSPPAKL